MKMQLFKHRRSAPPKTRQVRTVPRAERVTDLLQAAQELVLKPSDSDVVLDLSNVSQITSDELSEIICLHLACRENEKRLVVANPQGVVAEILEITRLGRTVNIRNHSSAGEAAQQIADEFQFANVFLGRYPAKQHA